VTRLGLRGFPAGAGSTRCRAHRRGARSRADDRRACGERRHDDGRGTRRGGRRHPHVPDPATSARSSTHCWPRARARLRQVRSFPWLPPSRGLQQRARAS